MPRDTTTGGVLEQLVLPALEHGGYQYHKQVRVSTEKGTTVFIEKGARARLELVS